jgi:hypothetical protein
VRSRLPHLLLHLHLHLHLDLQLHLHLRLQPELSLKLLWAIQYSWMLGYHLHLLCVPD